MKNCWSAVFGIGFLTAPILVGVVIFSVVGYQDHRDTWNYEKISTTAVSVRVLQDNKTIVRDANHPVQGAIVGTLLLGGAGGAIIGAAAGSGNSTTTTTNDLQRCNLQTKDKSGVHNFYLHDWNSQLKDCAMVHPGDKLNLYRHVQTNTHTGKVLHDFITWGCATNDRDGVWECVREGKD